MEKPYITFEISEVKCGTATNKAEIERIGAIAIIKGSVNVPDPCYELRYDIEEKVESSELTINIKALKKKIICIKCLARITFVFKINTMALKGVFNSREAKINIVYNIRGKKEELFSDTVTLG